MMTVTNTNDIDFDGESLLDTVISLPPDGMQRAAQLCQSITDADLQWQTYLDAIALFGLEEWLRDRTPDLSLSTQHSPLLQNSGERSHRVVNRLDAGQFQLCILSIGTLTDTLISVPAAAVEETQQVPHFYVLVDVEEEYEQVRIAGFLRSDQLAQSLLMPTADGDYAFALNRFETNPEDLLLYLRCLDPEAIARPEAVSSSEGSKLKEQAINVGNWLRGRLDEVATELSWILLPAPAVEPVMLSTRMPTEQYDAVIRELIDQQGIDIPSHAVSAYRDLCSGTTDLRLYVVTWEERSPESVPEWTLLLILGSPPDSEPPVGVRMTVRDQQQLLVDQTLTDPSLSSYLFAQVVGEQHEQFWVKIGMNNGVVVTLPPFQFVPGA